MHVSVILGVVLLQAIYVFAAPPDWIPRKCWRWFKATRNGAWPSTERLKAALIDEVNDGKLTDDRSITCYMHCLLDAFSLVDEEGDLEVDMLLSVIPENFQEVGTQILNKCAKQDGADPCEKIFNVAKCVQATVPELWFMV